MANSRSFAVLKRRSDFLQIQKSGKRFHPSSWLLVNYLPNETNELRCGWTVSRFIGPAVVRNRMKRWCRDYLQKNLKLESDFGGLDINFVFKRQPETFYRHLMRKDFDEALDKTFSRLRKMGFLDGKI